MSRSRTHDTQGARSSSGSVGERKYSTTFLMKQCIFVFDCFERWIYSEGFILNCDKIWNLRRLAYQTVENMHSCIFCAAMGEKNHYMLYFRRLSEISLNYSCCIKKSEACLLEWMFKLRSKSLYYWIHVKWKKASVFVLDSRSACLILKLCATPAWPYSSILSDCAACAPFTYAQKRKGHLCICR